MIESKCDVLGKKREIGEIGERERSRSAVRNLLLTSKSVAVSIPPPCLSCINEYMSLDNCRVM